MGKGKFRKRMGGVVSEFRDRYMPPKFKLFIAMPTYAGATPYTQRCLDNTRTYLNDRGVQVSLYRPFGISLIEKARNECIKKFLESSDTHFLFVDDDMIWNPEDVEAMLLHDTDVCSALVCKRQPPFNPTMYTIVIRDNKELETVFAPLGTYPVDRTFYYPNSGIGTAFMMIKRDVFLRIPYPYFAVPPTAAGELRGEDLYFCMNLGAKGIKILYDPTLRIYHMGDCPFGIEDHIAFMSLAQEFPELKMGAHMSFGGDKTWEFKKDFAGPMPDMIMRVKEKFSDQYDKMMKAVEENEANKKAQFDKLKEELDKDNLTPEQRVIAEKQIKELAYLASLRLENANT